MTRDERMAEVKRLVAEAAATPPTCDGCRHYRGPDYLARCQAPIGLLPQIRATETLGPVLRVARAERGFCGPEGLFYEPRRFRDSEAFGPMVVAICGLLILVVIVLAVALWP